MESHPKRGRYALRRLWKVLLLAVLACMFACTGGSDSTSGNTPQRSAGCPPGLTGPQCDVHVVRWEPAPVILHAARDYRTDEVSDGTATVDAPVEFEVPKHLPVSTGNAGNGLLEFSFRNRTGPIVRCTYQGHSPVAHPATDIERARGWSYRLLSCDGSATVGASVRATWFSLRLLGGDDAHPARKTAVDLHLGGGCSGNLPAPIPPDEVVAMRDNFHWDTVNDLAQTDPDGNPALWHGLIYIDHKEQLQALDRWRVYWSTRPISHKYSDAFRGKCGRVEHASDGRGIVVYAIFPAKLFNLLRHYSVAAQRAGKQLPFRFVIPSTPNEPGHPEYTNEDGSLSYKFLASSKYGHWLAAHPRQKPWFGEDIADAVGDAVSAVAEPVSDVIGWVGDNVVDPLTGYVEPLNVFGEILFDYGNKLYDGAIDWFANALDDTWEAIQRGLQEFVLVFQDSVNVSIDFNIVNADPAFPQLSITSGDTLFQRAWGPPAAGGARPFVRPAGVHVRIKQWGFGFLPVADEAEMGDDGHVDLEAIKGAGGRDGDICVELESNDGMITTDLVPNEVCGFYGLNFDGIDHDWRGQYHINESNLLALTQIKDSADYARAVIHHEPHKADVLTGSVANNATNILNGGNIFSGEKERAMTLCLDFPSTGAGLLTLAASGVDGGTGTPLGLAGVVVGNLTGLFSGPILEKDIWWPDDGAAQANLTSRGVMTHEYGHFNMCDLLFDEGGSTALSGLIMRVFDGQNDQRDDETALMTEAMADEFAMQVVGGASYIAADKDSTPPSSFVDGKMHYCTTNPCMDRNYNGKNDYARDDEKDGPFYDELAKYEGLVHDAFDRSDAANRLTNEPWNGDVWARAKSSSGKTLVFSPTGYTANDDEPVSLPGSAWRTWIKAWLTQGSTPTKRNVLYGLGAAMARDGRTATGAPVTWCDRCEVFAPHYPSTPDAARMKMATGTRTIGFRLQRWASCASNGEMMAALGPAPEPYANLDGSCHACPSRQFSNNGVCMACPVHQVPRTDHCEACPSGTVASEQNTCVACGSNEITVGDTCVACPFGTQADRSTNMCVDCPAVATIDWNTMPRSCSEAKTVSVPASAQTRSSALGCAGQVWVQVDGLSNIVAHGGISLNASMQPAKTPTTCTSAHEVVQVYKRAPDGGWAQVKSSDIYGRPLCDHLAPGAICATPCADNASLSFSPTELSSGPSSLRFLVRSETVLQSSAMNATPTDGAFALSVPASGYPECHAIVN